MPSYGTPSIPAIPCFYKQLLTAHSDSIIQAINDSLPIRIWTNRIVAGANEYEGENYGLYMVFPNPLNREKYVVISHGTILGWVASPNLENFVGQWPDYAVFDMTIETGSHLPAAWVEDVFLDQYWRLDNDEDGLDDIYEKEVIDADPDDQIKTLEDVNPHDDFDGDGHDNQMEYNAGTDATDAQSFFSAPWVRPDPADGTNCQVSWKVAQGRSYYILWADSMDGLRHEIEKFDTADLSDDRDVRTWTDKGTHPSMEGKKPGDCTARYYKVAAYR